jgi:dinuclear metal center YbgI/SA1388 family protein
LPKALHQITEYLDGYLRVSEVPDDARAVNGLQLEGNKTISRIGAAVDACQATIEMAAARKVDLLLVHHGLFWSGLAPLTGIHGRRIRSLIANEISIYSAHLPLDCHPEVGNNHVFAGQLGVQNLEPFGVFEGMAIGVAGDLRLGRSELASRIQKILGPAPRLIPGGPANTSRVAIITGAGSSELNAAAEAGLDTFITGEGPHHTYLLAEELGINLIYAGHYATETVGVRALAEHLSKRFDLEWEFLDHPTGM